jgi:hypothetical protein
VTAAISPCQGKQSATKNELRNKWVTVTKLRTRATTYGKKVSSKKKKPYGKRPSHGKNTEGSNFSIMKLGILGEVVETRTMLPDLPTMCQQLNKYSIRTMMQDRPR